MSNAILITVRSNSKRLPNKALLKINNKHTIEYVIERAKKSKLADQVVLCTTSLPEDKILCEIAESHKIKYFCGSENDKLERWLQACKKFEVDFFVTADGDDLFCEPLLMDLAFDQHMKSGDEFIECKNIICGAFTYGISHTSLQKACDLKGSDDTEMMWVYFTETGIVNPISLFNVPEIFLRDDIRMTLDYPDDLKFFKNLVDALGENCNLHDIVRYIDDNPEVSKINYYLQEQWAENQKNNTTLVIK